MAVLYLEQVNFSYDSKTPTLKNISFPVEKGDFLGILGPNGSGKSTLMGIMSGILYNFTGTVNLEDKPIAGLSRREIAKKMAYVPQHIQVDFPFTVREIVLMGRFAYLSTLGIEKETDHNIADESMKLTGVFHLQDRMIHQISGGERQRVFIAQAITSQPEILMLDEPISNLDIKYKVAVLQLLQKLNNEKGITIITSLHDLNLTSQYVKNILFIKKGEVSAMGSPTEIMNPPTLSSVYDIELEVHKSTLDETVSYFLPKKEVEGRK